MTFEDQQGFYNKSSKLCGSIKYTVASSTYASDVNNPADIKADQVTYDSMRAIVVAALAVVYPVRGRISMRLAEISPMRSSVGTTTPSIPLSKTE